MPLRGGAPGSLYTQAGLRKYLSHSERCAFIAAAKAHPRKEVGTLCLTLAYTGCRISEALGVTAGGVEIGERFVALRSLKRRHRAIIVREVPLPAFLTKTLARVHGLRSSAPTSRLWPWSRSRAWQLIKLVMSEAGIAPGIHATPKGLRHGFGLNAIRHGIPLNLVQRWLGHASMTTTAIYLQAMGVEEREIAQRMW
jgi:integrase/recombinase XerD